MASAHGHLVLVRGQGGKVKEAHLFILSGSHNAASLAAKLAVSLPTASRLIDVLRKDLARQEKRLVSVRSESGFHYEIRDEDREARMARDPLVIAAIPARGKRRSALKAEDRDLYDRD